MGDNPASARDGAQEDLMARVDTSVPVSARIWNYWMGGSDYYPVDKQAGDAYATLSPGVFDLASSAVPILIRAVRYAAADLGVRQFLDCGSGLPSHGPTHEVAQAVAPESRIVYVDHDPLVLAHARALLDQQHARRHRLHRGRPLRSRHAPGHRADEAGLHPAGRDHADGGHGPHRQPP